MPRGRLEEALERVDGLADVVRGCAAESERLGHLAPAVVDALLETGLFRMLVPEEHGGLDLTIPEAVRVQERLSALDASTGWTFTILADGPVFLRNLSEDAQTTLFRDPGTLVAGTLNPVTARAERVDGGYRYSGTASYLSGSAHATWNMASAIVTEGGEPVVEDGMLRFRSGVMPMAACRSLDTWKVTGMRATGSSDHAFEDVFVEDGWSFSPFALEPRDDTFSAIPLWAQLGGGLAAVAVGAARNAIDRFLELAGAKTPTGGFSLLAEKPSAQLAVGEATGLHHAAHAVLHQSVDEVWARGEARRPFDDTALAHQRLGSVMAVRLAAQAIDLLHDAAGMNAVKTDEVLDRVWRDIHTMTQHIILSPAKFEVTGRVLLGLDPNTPVI